MAIGSVAQQLASQNRTLVNIDSGIGNLSSSLTDFVNDQKRSRLDDLEAQQDAARSRQTSAGGASRPTGSIREGFSSGFGLPALAGASFGVGAFLAKGGLKALAGSLLFAASDNVAKYIENETGNGEFADATQRAMEGASLGILFGPKGALIGALGGILITPENAQLLKELGTSISTRATELSTYLSQLGVTLPSVSDMMSSMATGFGDMVKFSTSMVDGDFKKAFTDFDDTAVAIAATAVGAKYGLQASKDRKLRRQGIDPRSIRPAPPPAPAPLTGRDLDANMQNRTKNLSNRQVRKLTEQGFSVNKNTGALTGSDGRILSRDAKNQALKGVGSRTESSTKRLMKAFPRLAKVVPLLGTALSVGSIGSVLLDDSLGQAEKAKRVAGALGGIGGATLGGFVGLLGAPFLGPLAPLAPILGAGLGAYFGDELATAAANWLIGGNPPGQSESVLSSGALTGSADMSNQIQIPDMLKAPSSKGANLQLQNNETKEIQRQVNGGGNTIINAPSSNTSISGGGGGSTMSASDMPFDMHDFLSPYGR